MTIIEGPQADEQMIVDLIEFDARSQIVAVADGTARADSEVWPEVQRRRGDLLDWDAVDSHLVEIDAHLVGVYAGIDEHFGTMAVDDVRGIVVGTVAVGAADRTVVAGPRIAAVADESRQPAEVLAVNVAAGENFSADGKPIPRPRIANRKIIIMVIWKCARRGRNIRAVIAAVVALIHECAHPLLQISAEIRLPAHAQHCASRSHAIAEVALIGAPIA